jgi:hypothetical protein
MSVHFLRHHYAGLVSLKKKAFPRHHCAGLGFFRLPLKSFLAVSLFILDDASQSPLFI